MGNRVTITDLRNAIEGFNQGLSEAGATTRFVEQGRNGYQAVDEYPVDEDGDRIGSHVTRNVGCGTSKEVIAYTETRYYQLLAAHYKTQRGTE